MQAMQRGKNARKAGPLRKGEEAPPPEMLVPAPAEAMDPEMAAAAGMDPAQDAAAAKMQAAQRGKKARDEYLAQRKDKEEQEKAATKMQAMQRGKNARKKPAA